MESPIGSMQFAHQANKSAGDAVNLGPYFILYPFEKPQYTPRSCLWTSAQPSTLSVLKSTKLIMPASADHQQRLLHMGCVLPPWFSPHTNDCTAMDCTWILQTCLVIGHPCHGNHKTGLDQKQPDFRLVFLKTFWHLASPLAQMFLFMMKMTLKT